jgi:hypothetical protein
MARPQSFTGIFGPRAACVAGVERVEQLLDEVLRRRSAPPPLPPPPRPLAVTLDDDEAPQR